MNEVFFRFFPAPVFVLRSPEGRYKYSYDQGVQACKDFNATIASLQIMKDAADKGMITCNCCWADNQNGYKFNRPEVVESCGAVGFAQCWHSPKIYDVCCHK